MNIKSVYREVGLDALEVFPDNAVERNRKEDRIAKLNSPVNVKSGVRKGRKPTKPGRYLGNGYWSRPGWYITIKDKGRCVTILIFKDKLRDAIKEMKQQDPDKRIIHIERHNPG